MLYVRQLRIEKGIKQTDVAKALEISKQLYNHYELGKRQADYEMLLKMSEYFDTSVEFLLTGKHSGILEADPEKRLEMLHEKYPNDNSEIITEITAALAELSEHDLQLVLALCRAMIGTREGGRNSPHSHASPLTVKLHPKNKSPVQREFHAIRGI